MRINSDGGEIFDAIALYNSLKARNVHVIIDGICASAASIVAMSGKRITMKQGSMMMIHKPITSVKGDSEALSAAAELMSKLTDTMASIYSERTGLPKEQVLAIMDQEAYMTPDEAVAYRFADEVEPKDITPVAPVLPALPAPAPASATYEDGIRAERQRLRELDELLTPERTAIINRAKYETGASARDVAVDILKAEASRPVQAFAPLFPQVNGIPVARKVDEIIAAMSADIIKRRG